MPRVRTVQRATHVAASERDGRHENDNPGRGDGHPIANANTRQYGEGDWAHAPSGSARDEG
jgi:hypothetical protein